MVPEPRVPPDPLDQPGRLRCYDCGHAYDHLGDGHHHGRCPACGSPAVPPAGDLRVVSDLDLDPDPVTADGTTLRVDAVDDTGRRFGYWLSTLPDDRAQLVGVDASGAPVTPSDDAWPADLPRLAPDWLDSVLDVVGLRLVAPAPVVG
ncbi:hypothetical protein BRD10_00860 [Halobacteriales archaeon SW_12_71_31]|nr:MAG: hypothetical protein BRD10_00860 [Halobacteriales archaeon SW_12_71_31]